MLAGITIHIYFSGSQFFGKSDFSRANFQGEAVFNNSEFYGKTRFNYLLFEGKEKVIFDIENLSNAYFMNTDITGVRFYDKARRRGEKDKADRFKIVNDRLLEDKIEEEDGRTKDFNLGSIKAVYREVLENIMNIE